MPRLSGPEIIELRDILLEALPLVELDDVVMQLGTRRDRIILGQNAREIYREVVSYFNMRDAVDGLLGVARAANPTNAALFRFAQRHGLATAFPPEAADAAGVEAIIRKHLGTLDARAWLERAAAAENRVCLISDAGTHVGTGFLVGPEAVLTNYHVARRFIDGVDPARLEFRFDFMLLPDDRLGGTLFRAALPDWLIDHSPLHPSDDPLSHPGTPVNPPAPADVPPDRLDYALLSVAGRPGEAPVGGNAAPPDRSHPRGWLRLTGAPVDFAANRALFVYHHPEHSRVLQLSLDTDSFAQANACRTRAFYRSNTRPGSSGSPVFDINWNLVALHQGSITIGGERLNGAIPAAAIHALLATRGKVGALGG
jgi:hypothetical protein